MTTSLSVLVGLQWAGLIGLGFVVLGLARQIGVLHHRLGPAGALMLSKAAKVGERSPEIQLRSINGGEVVIGERSREGKSQLLMFVAPDCPVCSSLMPAIRSIGKSEADHTRLIFASDGDAKVHKQYVSKNRLEDFPYVLSSELGMRFSIGRLPYAVLIDANGIVASQGLVNSREHIESLFEAQRLKIPSIQDYMHGTSGANGTRAAVQNS